MESTIVVLVILILLVASISWMVRSKRKSTAHEVEVEKDMEKDRHQQRPPMP